jgi:hypothetical protein
MAKVRLSIDLSPEEAKAMNPSEGKELVVKEVYTLDIDVIDPKWNYHDFGMLLTFLKSSVVYHGGTVDRKTVPVDQDPEEVTPPRNLLVT